ncbi:hypothetical protein BGZ76_007310, partial [Entomortierella beljakovae]
AVLSQVSNNDFITQPVSRSQSVVLCSIDIPSVPAPEASDQDADMSYVSPEVNTQDVLPNEKLPTDNFSDLPSDLSSLPLTSAGDDNMQDQMASEPPKKFKSPHSIDFSLPNTMSFSTPFHMDSALLTNLPAAAEDELVEHSAKRRRNPIEGGPVLVQPDEILNAAELSKQYSRDLMLVNHTLANLRAQVENQAQVIARLTRENNSLKESLSTVHSKVTSHDEAVVALKSVSTTGAPNQALSEVLESHTKSIDELKNAVDSLVKGSHDKQKSPT